MPMNVTAAAAAIAQPVCSVALAETMTLPATSAATVMLLLDMRGRLADPTCLRTHLGKEAR